jgi:hypothetical protein
LNIESRWTSIDRRATGIQRPEGEIGACRNSSSWSPTGSVSKLKQHHAIYGERLYFGVFHWKWAGVAYPASNQ